MGTKNAVHAVGCTLFDESLVASALVAALVAFGYGNGTVGIIVIGVLNLNPGLIEAYLSAKSVDE